MAKDSAEVRECKEASRQVKKYVTLLEKDGRETKEAAVFYEKHKGNRWFVIFANLARGIGSAMDKGKQVVIKLRHKPGKPPKLTRVPHRAFRPGKN